MDTATMTTQNTTIVLISVYGNQEPEQGMYDRRLYELLEERKPWQNISHRAMPTFADHVLFVRSRPYTCWYAIYDGAEFIGSIYLTDINEIGLFIKEGKERKGYGRAALQSLMLAHPKKYYLANIAPRNNNSQAFFANVGFQHRYTTYNEDGDVLEYTFKFVAEALCCEPVIETQEAQSATPDLRVLES